MADRYQNKAYPLDDGYGRQPAQQQPSAENDPLAELARLIGQSDPFNNFGRDARPAPSRDTSFGQHTEEHDPAEVPPPGPPSWMQRMRQNAAAQQPAYEEAADERSYHQSPSFAPADDVQPDPSRYDNVLYGQPDQGYGQEPRFEQQQNPNYTDDPYAYRDEAYAESEAEPEQKPRRGGLLTVAVVIALGVVGTAGAYAYRSFVSAPRSGEPPVIKADTGPTKIVPPANQPTDGSKLIYDRIGQGGAAPERVVSREEQPIDVNSKAGGPRVVFPPLNQGGSATVPAAGGARVAAAPPSAGQSEEPRKVRTLSIRPDQAEPAPAPAPAKQPPRAAAPPPPAANANASANSPLSLSPQQQATASQRSAPPAAVSGNYVVQVSSQRSEADAQASYRALQGKYPSVLGSRSASIRRADLGDRGVYYRAMVGPFGSSEDATRLCDSLKAAGGQCNIMRN